MARTLLGGRRLSLEWKAADKWIGVFHTDTDVWVCVLPCLPIHYRRERRRDVEAARLVAKIEAAKGVPPDVWGAPPGGEG
jgi:hypothetical protein